MIKRLLLALALTVPLLPALAQQDQQQTVDSALATLGRMKADAKFHESFQSKLDQARAVVIVPALYKGGFVFGGQYGNGVIMAKMEDGSWSYPAFYAMEGGSFGLQIGLESTAVLFVVMSDKGLQAVLDNPFKFGADTGITAVVVGASTMSNLGADIYAYSLTGVGLYGGLSLEGTMLSVRENWNATYYGSDISSRAILLDNSVSNPKADPLRDSLAH